MHAPSPAYGSGDTASAREDMRPGRTLHLDFVGMLFALAIAHVALRAGGIANSGLPLQAMTPAAFHLVLAAIVIATSWVSWGQSAHGPGRIESVFSRRFVVLLFDVWLVVVYFFLADSAERLAGGDSADSIGSAGPEAGWVLVIFTTYLAWDVVTKWPGCRALAQPTWHSLPLAKRGWQALPCALLALATFLTLRETDGTRPAVFGDLSLIVLVFLFRAMKTPTVSAFAQGLLVFSWALLLMMAAG